MYRVFELVLIMGTAWALLVIARFTLWKNRKSPDRPYGAAVIAVFLLCILDNLLRPAFVPMGILDYIYPVTRLSYFLVGPVLLYYVRILLKPDFKIGYKALLHLIPFVIWFIYVLIDPASLHPKITFGSVPGAQPDRAISPLFSFSFFWDLSVNASRLLYCVFILILLKRNADKLPDRVSNINKDNTLSWLKYLMIFYTAVYLIYSLIHLFFPEELLFTQIAGGVSRNLPPVLFVFLFSLFSENQPLLPFESTDADLNGGEQKETAEKYKKSGTSEGESRFIYEKLCHYLETTKAYLDPEMTLHHLADQTKESRQRLSEVINRESGKKFYTFINEFRMKEFHEAVETGRYPEFTILAIAFECGFRSSSGFYSMVKQKYGKTPKALVKELTSPGD